MSNPDVVTGEPVTQVVGVDRPATASACSMIAGAAIAAAASIARSTEKGLFMMMLVLGGQRSLVYPKSGSGLEYVASIRTLDDPWICVATEGLK